MIDFNAAIYTAYENINQLVKQAENITLEEAILNKDKTQYEITLSYDLNNAYADALNPIPKTDSLYRLATVLGKRKQYKVFLIDVDGTFRGFKRYKGE